MPEGELKVHLIKFEESPDEFVSFTGCCSTRKIYRRWQRWLSTWNVTERRASAYRWRWRRRIFHSYFVVIPFKSVFFWRQNIICKGKSKADIFFLFWWAILCSRFLLTLQKKVFKVIVKKNRDDISAFREVKIIFTFSLLLNTFSFKIFLLFKIFNLFFLFNVKKLVHVFN